ncbi:MAG: hypothetical protein ACW990_15265 [Promethearchaeota archaeon]
MYENGALRKVTKIDFKDTKVYLIDDLKTIYLWFGLTSSKRKREFGKKRANDLIKKKKSNAIIQVHNQDKEHGAFLAILELLKHGLNEKKPIVIRNELALEIEDTLELLDTGLEMDLEAEISLATHKLSQEKIPYDDLSKRLAKLQIVLINGNENPSLQEIEKKAEEINKSSSTYDELCWLVSELEILIEKKQLK